MLLRWALQGHHGPLVFLFDWQAWVQASYPVLQQVLLFHIVEKNILFRAVHRYTATIIHAYIATCICSTIIVFGAYVNGKANALFRLHGWACWARPLLLMDTFYRAQWVGYKDWSDRVEDMAGLYICGLCTSTPKRSGPSCSKHC